MTDRETRAPQVATDPVTYMSPGLAQIPTWDAETAAYMYYANVVIYAAVAAIATDIAALPFRAGLDPNEPEVYNTKSRLAQLLGPEPGSPNDEMSTQTFWRYTAAQWVLTGKFGWELERAGSDVKAIWPLVAKTVRPIVSRSAGEYFSGIEVATSTRSVRLNKEKSVYHWRPSIEDVRQPESALRAARLDGYVMIMQDRYDYSFLKNDARPAAVVVHEAFANLTEREAWREKFIQDHGGPENAGRVFFLETSEDGANPKDAFDIKVLGLSQADAQFIERYNQKLRGIVMALGVPMSRLGDTSERTYSNADAEIANYYENTLIPLTKEFAGAVNRKLAPKLGREVGWFDISSLKEKSRNRIIATMSIPELVRTRIIKLNEARAAISLEPVEGGDRFLTDEELALLQQGALALIDTAGPKIKLTEKDPEDLEPGETMEEEAAEPPEPEDVDTEDDGAASGQEPPEDQVPPAPPPTGQARTKKRQRQTRSVSDMEDALRSKHELRRTEEYKRIDKEVRREEEAYRETFQDLIDRQLKTTLNRLDSKRGRKMLAESRDVLTDAASSIDVSLIYDREFWLTQTEAAVVHHYANAIADVLVATSGRFGVSFTQDAPFAQEFINKRANQLAWNVTQTTYEDIQAQLMRGASAGESIPQLATRIRNLFDQTYKNRARTVARTEVISAYNGSVLETGKQLPKSVVAAQEWLATGGTRTRASHMAAHGQVREIGDKFDVGGSLLEYPGDPAGAAKEVVNCRCSLTLLTPDDVRELGVYGLLDTSNGPDAPVPDVTQ